MKRAVIFDLDGTLLNTLEDLTDSTNYALSKFSYPPHSIEEVRGFVGNGVAKLIERSIPFGIENPNYTACVDIFKQHYQENMYNKTMPYDGIVDMLKKIKLRDYKIAVTSNKFDMAVKQLCKKYFENLIDFAIGENTAVGINKKPSPDMITKVLQKFNLNSEQTLYVGDSEVDLMTAHNANIPCISVLWGFKDRDFLIKNGAKILIDVPDEIFKYL